uniref:CUB domain-containing protein n=1 Tax=Eptatretus burgeri TaxID=7764 RepID=A0A8C4WYE6_EPTBU
MSNLRSDGDEGTFQMVFSNLTWNGESVQLQNILEPTTDDCLLLHVCPQLCEQDLCTKRDGLFLVFTPACDARLVVDLCLHACRAHHLLLPSKLLLMKVFVAAPMEVVQQVQMDVWYHIVNSSAASDMTTTKCRFMNDSAQQRGMLLQYHLTSDEIEEKVSIGQPVESRSTSLLDFLTSFKLFEGLSSALPSLIRNSDAQQVLSNWIRRSDSRKTFDQIHQCESMMLSSAIEPPQDCQLEFFNKSGNLYPPGFPDHYRENVTCQWTIHAQLAKRIMLKICNFGAPSNCCEIEDRIVFEELSPNGVNTTLWACWGRQVSLYSPLGQGVKVSLVVGGALPPNVSFDSRHFWGEYRVLDKYEMLDITWLACDEWGLSKNVGSDQTLDERDLDRTINDQELCCLHRWFIRQFQKVPLTT